GVQPVSPALQRQKETTGRRAGLAVSGKDFEGENAGHRVVLKLERPEGLQENGRAGISLIGAEKEQVGIEGKQLQIRKVAEYLLKGAPGLTGLHRAIAGGFFIGEFGHG